VAQDTEYFGIFGGNLNNFIKNELTPSMVRIIFFHSMELKAIGNRLTQRFRNSPLPFIST